MTMGEKKGIRWGRGVWEIAQEILYWLAQAVWSVIQAILALLKRLPF